MPGQRSIEPDSPGNEHARSAALVAVPPRPIEGALAHGPRVLVIDDDEVVGKHIALHLRRVKYRVTRAVDGAQALASLKNDPPDVIVLDHYLPDTSGEELLEIIRQDPATCTIPVIYLTVDGSHRRFRKSMTAGADDFLAKPFEAQELIDAVKAQLRKAYARMFAHADATTVSNRDEAARLAAEMKNIESRLALAYEEQRRAQMELSVVSATIDHRVAQKTRSLTRQNAILQAYGHTIAHELRKPLRGILGFTGLLMESRGADSDDESAVLLERIERSGRRMNEFIEGLLTMAQAERGPLKRVAVDLSVIARDIVAAQPMVAGALALEVRIADKLIADADPVLSRIVLENLLSNALKYTSKSLRPVTEFDACEINGETVFFVRDNGAGFNMRDAERLFQPFNRLHAAADYEGLGIGLATVQRIVERHEGRIWAKGEAGEGATFFFTLQPATVS